MPTVGDLIRKKRIEKNLSQRKLAKLCGMSYSHICRLEKGGNMPSVDTIAKISDALGEPFSAFSVDGQITEGMKIYLEQFEREQFDVFYDLVKFIDIHHLSNKYDARLFGLEKNRKDMMSLLISVVENRLKAYTEENEKTKELEKYLEKIGVEE